MDFEYLQVGIVGHSFVRILASYALENCSMNLDLDPEHFNVTFVARDGLLVEHLYVYKPRRVSRGSPQLHHL